MLGLFTWESLSVVLRLKNFSGAHADVSCGPCPSRHTKALIQTHCVLFVMTPNVGIEMHTNNAIVQITSRDCEAT